MYLWQDRQNDFIQIQGLCMMILFPLIQNKMERKKRKEGKERTVESEFWKREKECWKLSIKRRGRKAVQSQRGWDLNLLTVWKKSYLSSSLHWKERGERERGKNPSKLMYTLCTMESKEWEERKQMRPEREREIGGDVFYVFIWKKGWAAWCDKRRVAEEGGEEGREGEKRISLSCYFLSLLSFFFHSIFSKQFF